MLDSLMTAGETGTLNKLLAGLDNTSHPLHSEISKQRSSFNDGLHLPKCNTNRLKNSFVPPAIKVDCYTLGGRQVQRRTEDGEEQ